MTREINSVSWPHLHDWWLVQDMSSAREPRQRHRVESAKGSAAASKVAYEILALPLAFAAPDAIPLLPRSPCVELFASLIYMQVMPRLGRSDEPAKQVA